mgnify:CR=1 FL=1
MGDRATVAVKQKEGTIYLYTHWDGYRLHRIVQHAIARRQRWDDETYLTRIIFSEMVREAIDAETGYGIGLSEPGDVQYPTIVVDLAKQEVRIDNYTASFEELASISAAELDLRLKR